jgi:hypothetical protein
MNWYLLFVCFLTSLVFGIIAFLMFTAGFYTLINALGGYISFSDVLFTSKRFSVFVTIFCTIWIYIQKR